MSSFEVKVRRIDKVEDHPGADRLSICTILGFRAITAKNEDGSHRFATGDLIVYVPEQAVVPHDLLKQYGYWDDAKDKGLLAGRMGDRVKIIKLRGEYSQGLVWPLGSAPLALEMEEDCQLGIARKALPSDNGIVVAEGDDVAEFFGIIKHEPPAAGFREAAGTGGIDKRVVFVAPEFALSYDFDSIQRHPTFLANDEIEVTEKLHGTLTRVSYRPGVNHPDLFGNGDVAITTKGQGAKGIVFKNSRFNLGPRYQPTRSDMKRAHWAKRLWWCKFLHKKLGLTPEPSSDKTNLYVAMALDHGLIDAVGEYGRHHGVRVDLVGETFGNGVQKNYAYGLSEPVFRAFDIAIDGVWQASAEKQILFNEMGIERVPVLWKGMFDLKMLIALRDGKTTIGAGPGIKSNIREGIVLTATGPQTGRERRPILKMVSPEYLLKEDEDAIQ